MCILYCYYHDFVDSNEVVPLMCNGDCVTLIIICIVLCFSVFFSFSDFAMDAKKFN